MNENKNYIVVIDTDKYAGNFEREMTAFITGQVGDCSVGSEQAEKCPSDIVDQFEDIIDNIPDEHGCCRPCVIWQSKRHGHNNQYSSVAIFFNRKPTDKLITIIKDRAERFTQYEYTTKNIHIEGFRLINKIITYEEKQT